MLWTPALDPPHPSTVPGLSPLARRIIGYLRQEIRQPPRPTLGVTPSRASPRLPTHPVVRSRYFSTNNGPNEHLSNHRPTATGFQCSNNTQNSMTQPHCSYMDLKTDLPMRPTWSNNVHFQPQQNNTWLSNVGESSRIYNQTKTPKNNTNLSTYEEFQSDLSPDMEFEHLEVYSFPRGGVITKPKEQRKTGEILQFMPSPTLNTPVLQFISKEDHSFENNKIKPNTSSIKGLQPSDQTFVFTSKTPTPTFKKKLAQFKMTDKANTMNSNGDNKNINNKPGVKKRSLQKNNETNTTSSKTNVHDKQKYVGADIRIINNHHDQTGKNETNDHPQKKEERLISESVEKNVNKMYNQYSLETNKQNPSKAELFCSKTEQQAIAVADNNQTLSTDNSETYESLFINTQNSDYLPKNIIGTEAKESKNDFISLANTEENSEDEFDVENLFSLKNEVVLKIIGKNKAQLNTPKFSERDTTAQISEDGKLNSRSSSDKIIENKSELCKPNEKHNNKIFASQNVQTANDIQTDFRNILGDKSNLVEQNIAHIEIAQIDLTNTCEVNDCSKVNNKENHTGSILFDDTKIRRTPISNKRNGINRVKGCEEVALKGNQRAECSIQSNIEVRKSLPNKSLKQATIKQFLPPVFKTGEDAKDKRNQTDSDNCFKKPNPPKFHSSNSSRNLNMSSFAPKSENQTQLHFVPNGPNKTRPKKLGKSVDNGTKMKQTSLANPESVKRCATSSFQSDKKKPRFTAPVLTKHNTSQTVLLKDYNILELNDVNCDDVVDKVSTVGIQKVAVTVCFREGYTLLNKPDNPLKNAHCVPSGLMFMVLWQSGVIEHFYLHLAEYRGDPGVKSVVHCFITRPGRVVCFESQAFFMLMIDAGMSQDTSEWHALDPLVACWLLDPDNPPKDFAEVVVKLEVDRSLLIVNPKADKKTQACDLLPVLDLVMDLLQKRLCNASLWPLFCDFEMKLTPILAVMECSSIVVDIRKLHENAAVLDQKLKVLQKEAHQFAGHGFQLNSHQQLRQVLYDELKLDQEHNVEVKQTEQGAKSTSETVLCQLKPFHPLPNIVLQHRHLQKIKSTYVDGLLQFVKKNQDVCTISTTWEQVGTATGRITSKNPNLQAIPKIKVSLDEGEEIHLRGVFKAREDHSFLAADFQQIEFRVFAHYTQDVVLLQMFTRGKDIFTELSRRWLGGESASEREKTKRIVYAVMYGAGPQKLAEYLQVSIAEANSIIDNFVENFPSLRSLPKSVIAQCRTQGYVVTLSGRRRLFPHIRSTNYKLRSYSERQAINFLIQGSAADICKAAMLDSERELKARNLEAKLLLQIHDELIWEVRDQHLQETARVVRQAMEHSWGERLTLKVSVPVSICSSKTLADMTPLGQDQ